MIEPLVTRFTRLEKARRDLERELKLLSTGQLAFRPDEHSWSIGEVLDHVVRVETSVLEGARKPGVNRRRWKAKPFRRIITWVAFAVGLRIRVPERVMHVVPQRDARAEDALARWETHRAELREFLDSIPRTELDLLAIKHPIAGPFTYRNFLAFLEWHLRHHRRQISRIRLSPEFPH